MSNGPNSFTPFGDYDDVRSAEMLWAIFALEAPTEGGGDGTMLLKFVTFQDTVQKAKEWVARQEDNGAWYVIFAVHFAGSVVVEKVTPVADARQVELGLVAKLEAKVADLSGWVRNWECVVCQHTHTLGSADAKPAGCVECGGVLVPQQQARLERKFYQQASRIGELEAELGGKLDDAEEVIKSIAVERDTLQTLLADAYALIVAHHDAVHVKAAGGKGWGGICGICHDSPRMAAIAKAVGGGSVPTEVPLEDMTGQ